MNIINAVLKYKRDKKEQYEIDMLIRGLYLRMYHLSNMDERIFLNCINNFLKEYDNWRFVRDSNILFYYDKDGKVRRMTREQKLKFIFPDRK